jgi:hypothetical protein
VLPFIEAANNAFSGAFHACQGASRGYDCFANACRRR